MIKKIHIQALKSIKDMTVSCKKMNVIVGTNSSGKSTFLQSILLEAQNSAGEYGLNGPLAKLGEFNEAHNHSSARNESIKIEIWTTKQKPFTVEFKYDDSESKGYVVKTSNSENDSVIDVGCGYLLSDDVSDAIVYDIDIHYLSAGRIGVQDVYLKNSTAVDDFGINGEFAIGYLQEHEDDVLEQNMLNDVENFGDSLAGQVNFWLLKILGNTSMKTRSVSKTNFAQIL